MARKNADFNLDDRIHIRYQASEKLAAAIERFSERIQAETLAKRLTVGDGDESFYTEDFTESLPKDLDGETLVVSVKQID